MRKHTFPLLVIAVALASVCGITAQHTQAPFRWPEGKRVAVSLSFDDARESQVDVGVPLFDKYGARATFYVNPGRMEKRLDGWKKAATKGYEIGNHTKSHPCTGNFAWSRKNALENYTAAMMEAELDGANADTERLIGVRPATFAYPCGEKFFSRGVETKSYVPLVAKRFLAGRGFRDESANDPVSCDFAQLLGVESDGMTFEQMKQTVADAAREGSWLVFAGHEIGAPARQTTTVAALEQFLKYAKDPASGIWLDTVENIAKYVQSHRNGK